MNENATVPIPDSGKSKNNHTKIPKPAYVYIGNKDNKYIENRTKEVRIPKNIFHVFEILLFILTQLSFFVDFFNDGICNYNSSCPHYNFISAIISKNLVCSTLLLLVDIVEKRL